MFSAGVLYYHQNTSDCIGTAVNSNGKCLSCNEPAHVTISVNSSDGNASTIPNHSGRSVQITIVRTAKDVEKELSFEEKPDVPAPRKSFYRANLKPIKEAWRTRWRPTQQRPRDGLR